MKRLLAAGLFCLVATGCTKVPYVVSFDGTWAGTASAQGGAALVMTALFKWNEEQEYLSGNVDLDGWVYDQGIAVTSDKESATITLVHNAGGRALNLVEAVHEEDTLSGTFEVDVCYNATLAGTTQGTGGANCITSGTFNLTRN